MKVIIDDLDELKRFELHIYPDGLIEIGVFDDSKECFIYGTCLLKDFEAALKFLKSNQVD